MYKYIYGCTCVCKGGRRDGKEKDRAGVVAKQRYIMKMAPNKIFLLEGKPLKNF